MKETLILIFLSSSIMYGFCQPSMEDKRLYQIAALEAMCPDFSKIDRNLLSFNNRDVFITVVTWVRATDIHFYYDTSNKIKSNYPTNNYNIWVTANNELKDKLRSLNILDSTSSKRYLRLQQILGLAPDTATRFFVEFDVKYDDLFRPCPDSEIDDELCNLSFREGTDLAHMAWINAERVIRFLNCKGLHSPWTQLGYTYDWCPTNTSHIGLSEFVIKTHTIVKIRDIYSTEDYLK